MGESWPLSEHCLTTRADVELQGIVWYGKSLLPKALQLSGNQVEIHVDTIEL